MLNDQDLLVSCKAILNTSALLNNQELSDIIIAKIKKVDLN
jgi:hypothetical protein